jgi:hypothetical protein
VQLYSLVCVEVGLLRKPWNRLREDFAMAKLVNPLFVEYTLTCTFPGCGWKRKIEQAQSAGWKEGDMIPEDPSHPDVTRCMKCKRHMMKVTGAPPLPPPTKSVGWTRIPTE